VRSRKAKLNADRISELERKSGQQTMEIEFLKIKCCGVSENILGQSPSTAAPTL
jgi:hypothetical protein